MDDSPETVVPTNVQARGAAHIGDRLRDRTKWRRLIHRLVRAVPVVVVLELPQRALEMPLVPDQGAIEQLMT
jgi:hypothetical protein